MAESPRNFSWIDGNQKVGGSGIPTSPENIQFLRNENVGTIISLTENQLSPDLLDGSIKNVHVPVLDFNPPTPEQIDTVNQAIEGAIQNGKGAVIHCKAGKGRTGTLLACWLVKSQNLSGEEAIQEIRKLRPGSVETVEQQNVVVEYSNRLKSSN